MLHPAAGVTKMARRSETGSDAARICDRGIAFDTPWVRLTRKTVDFGLGTPAAEYFALELPDYTAICPRTRAGKIIIVRQYRPAIERYSWEFPAGLIDKAETPETSIQRELVEEAGYRVSKLVSLGTFFPDVGRLSNKSHHFFGEVEAVEGWSAEPGITMAQVTPAELDDMIADGTFCFLHHVALWLQVKTAGLHK